MTLWELGKEKIMDIFVKFVHVHVYSFTFAGLENAYMLVFSCVFCFERDTV